MTPETLTQDALRIPAHGALCGGAWLHGRAGHWECAKAHINGLADISRERVRDNSVKILMADAKYGGKDGVLRGLHMLKELGALSCIVPALAEETAWSKSAQYHAHRRAGAFAASMRVRARRPCDPACGAAARHRQAGGAARNGKNVRARSKGRRACAVGPALRFDKGTADEVCALVGAHMFDLDNRAGRKAVVRMIARLGERQFYVSRMCAKRTSAVRGKGESGALRREVAGNAAELKEADAPISGSSLP